VCTSAVTFVDTKGGFSETVIVYIERHSIDHYPYDAMFTVKQLHNP